MSESDALPGPSVQVVKPAPPTSFRFSEGKPASAFYWLDGDFGYALTGNLPRNRLLELSESVYAQLAN